MLINKQCFLSNGLRPTELLNKRHLRLPLLFSQDCFLPLALPGSDFALLTISDLSLVSRTLLSALTMKLAVVATAVVSLFSTITSAWDVSPECLRRRQLSASNETVQFLTDEEGPVEKSGPYHEIVDRSGLNVTNKNLRGSGMVAAHRELEDVDYFQIRMYWEEGYCWQEENFERPWCWECEGSSCGKNDMIVTMKCKSTSKQRFVYEEVKSNGMVIGGKIKPYTRQDLCFERTRVNAYQLKTCDSNTNQIIVGFALDGRFELHPYGIEEKCLTQHHHPKSNEVIRAEFCESARSSKTSRWFLYNTKTGSDSGGTGDSSGTSEIRPRGREYCDDHKCDLCEGDCDNDSQCKGNLKCFQRKPYDSVPGCSGGSSDSSGKRLNGRPVGKYDGLY